jgi:hemin uptake protein HemP
MTEDRRSDHGDRGGRQIEPARPKTFRSVDMFAGAKEVLIEHHGATYRLRETSQGKLILTK